MSSSESSSELSNASSDENEENIEAEHLSSILSDSDCEDNSREPLLLYSFPSSSSTYKKDSKIRNLKKSSKIEYIQNEFTESFRKCQSTSSTSRSSVSNSSSDKSSSLSTTSKKYSIQSREYMESAYSILSFAGQGILAGMSLALLLLFSRFENDDAEFIVFYAPWAETSRALHHVLQTLFCCDVLDILLYRTSSSLGSFSSSSSSSSSNRWKRSSGLEIWLMRGLCLVLFVSMFLTGIMSQVDCRISVWPTEWGSSFVYCTSVNVQCETYTITDDSSALSSGLEIWQRWLDDDGGRSQYVFRISLSLSLSHTHMMSLLNTAVCHHQ